MNYTIHLLKENHIPKVLEIWGERMGRKYPEESKLYDAADINVKNTFGFVTMTNNSIIGFCIGKILTRKEAENMVPQLNLFDKSIEHVGLLDLNVVKKSYERNGIGTSQIKEREKYFNEKNINTMFAICWIRDKHPDSKLLLDEEGFRCVDKIDNFWYGDTLERNAKCIDCGGPCHCTAGIHIKQS